ncbi:hypothetical protein RUM44_011948 [Polyplax serrata]|uniref:Uncharacterized protein n=1 Tax=Polyplax serrata TaxID=468196 RepID=A0ABR1BDW4_POLSC
MECGVTATSRLTNGNGILSDVRSESSPAKAGLHVNFIEKTDVKEKREKFLTAKYGSHQMGLIRKRLAVEMWLYDELQKLFESPVWVNKDKQRRQRMSKDNKLECVTIQRKLRKSLDFFAHDQSASGKSQKENVRSDTISLGEEPKSKWLWFQLSPHL